MGTYSIKDLEQLSGIKAHTLRMWEQRYDVLQPKRTSTNIRYYSDEDLKLLLNISFLNKNGYKISRIADKSNDEISELVMEIANSNLEFPNQINALIIAMVSLDEARFEKIISTNTLQFGFEKTMINIVYPFLLRIGVLWQTGNINPAHEHFISNLIRQKLTVAIDGQVLPGNPYAKKYILFLPENELHEISLLFAYFIVKSRYNKVLYLGQSLPFEDLESVYDIYKADYVMTIITGNPSKEKAVAYAERLVKAFPKSEILLTGYQVMQQKKKMPKKAQIFDNMKSFIDFVDEHSVAPFGKR